jgi:hypothetical protein
MDAFHNDSVYLRSEIRRVLCEPGRYAFQRTKIVHRPGIDIGIARLRHARECASATAPENRPASGCCPPGTRGHPVRARLRAGEPPYPREQPCHAATRPALMRHGQAFGCVSAVHNPKFFGWLEHDMLGVCVFYPALFLVIILGNRLIT